MTTTKECGCVLTTVGDVITKRVRCVSHWARCPGSYGDGKPNTTRHPKAGTRRGRVTGECPACGKRVSYVTAHALPNKPRVLGLHAKPTDATT